MSPDDTDTRPRGRWLVGPGEGRALLAAAGAYFLLLAGYYMLRSLREAFALEVGRDYIASLFYVTFVVMLAILPLYWFVVARLPRRWLFPVIYSSVVSLFVLLGFGMATDPGNRLYAAVFFVAVTSLNLFIVSVFWSVMVDAWRSTSAQRLFGFIAAGGSAGAIAGPLFNTLFVERIGPSSTIFVACGLILAAVLLGRSAQRLEALTERDRLDPDARLALPVGGRAIDDLKRLATSPYLLGIALFVVLLSLVNTFLYFEQLRIVSETFSDTRQRTEMFATIDFIVQSLTIVSQLFLTGRIASKLGVRALLTFVPVIMIAGFALLSLLNVFGMIATLLVVRRFGEYAFIRPGREMLWSTLDTETKYKAKSFIDVPVYRAADYVGAQAKTAIEAMGTTPGGAALIGAVLAAIWAVNGWRLGSRHDAK
ncbi:MAG: MFS transporter [Gammaproteobacteria bacterium]|nr:MFS transporter [Gammaproteobacteria bacterium]